MLMEGFLMEKESINYEIMIELISNIVKKYIDDKSMTTQADN